MSSMVATHSASRQAVPGNEALTNILYRNDLKRTFKGVPYGDEFTLLLSVQIKLKCVHFFRGGRIPSILLAPLHF